MKRDRTLTIEDCLTEFRAGDGRAFRFPTRDPKVCLRAWTWNRHAGLVEWSFNPLPAFVYGRISNTVARQFCAALRREARAGEPLQPTLDGLDQFLRDAGAVPGDDVRALARFWFRWPCEEGCRDRADRGKAFTLQLPEHLSEGISRYAPAFAEAWS